MTLEQSRQWWRRAERIIPSGTQTLSKGPSQFVQGVCPVYLTRGRGSHVWDVDGNEYVDWPMGLGPLILGYAEPVVDDAIRRQLDDGITFTLMHPLEVEVAERIVALCPGVEAVRFAKSGSDVLSAAVRAARAATGRDHVVVGGYHGWHDWYIGSTTRDAGVPRRLQDLVSTFRFNDLASLEKVFAARKGQLAAVVLEPSAAEIPEPGFLRDVIDLAHRYGAISVFDEVITGFRLAPGGARQRYDVQPDLSCYGKALGNGMPFAALGGSWSIMSVFDEVFFSTTHGGETLSLAAARAVLDAVADGTVLAAIEERGRRLQDAIQACIDAHGIAQRVRVSGEPQRSVVSFLRSDHLVVKSLVQQTFARRGLLFNGSMFICARHTDEDVDRAVAAFDEAFATLAREDDVGHLLQGPPVSPVFRVP